MDARRFVEDYTGEPFDYVIDDVFCEDDDGEPIRAIAFDDDWYGKVCRIMTAKASWLRTLAIVLSVHARVCPNSI